MLQLAGRARDRRLAQNMTQAGLAARAGVSLGTLKLFERTGKASLETVLRIAFALGADAEFDQLFAALSPRTIDDVIEKPPRRRGRRK
ncbi:MAG: helix-turn-helix domain-containing protein [Devosia sp.]